MILGSLSCADGKHGWPPLRTCAVIKEHDILPRLLRACPDYVLAFNDYVELSKEIGTDPDLTYNATADFADWLIRVVAGGDSTSIKPFADELESLLVDGDQETQQVAVIGLIEDVQDGCVEADIDPDQFMIALGPVGRAKWFERLRWKFRDRTNRWKGTIEPPQT